MTPWATSAASVVPNGDLVEYLVDGRGRRVGKRLNGVLVNGWLWRGQLQPVAELDGAGNVVARFVHAGGVNVPALMMTPSATYRLVTDHLGSVRRVLDVATGVVVQELEYDAWGRVLLDTNPGLQPFGFAGGLYDPDTGLVRFGARDYDAETGRWTAKDPIRFGGGINLYAYTTDPVNQFDSTGTFFCNPTEYVRASVAFIAAYVAMLNDNVAGADKFYHCMANCYGSAGCKTGAAAASMSRELVDYFWKGDSLESCFEDMGANVAGILTPLGDCYSTCIHFVPESSRPFVEKYDWSL